MWNLKNLGLAIIMVIIDIYAVRGVILFGTQAYIAGTIICIIVTIAAFRNMRH